LLGDFADALTAEMPDDVVLLETALAGIERLNARYVDKNKHERPRFYLFHRRRLWNPAEGKWMGWERKRGQTA